MKAICKKTGLQLTISSGLARYNIASEHPIFSLRLEKLLEIAANDWSPCLPHLDKKLLLLAIGNNCELIKWDEKEMMPAIPSLSICESSIHKLLRIAGWIDWERSYNRHRLYPAYSINSATMEMGTFPDMLDRIIETTKQTESEERKQHRLIFLENAAQNLSARCRIGDKNKEGSLLRVTAEWALAVTEEALKHERVSKEIAADWLSMLQTSPSKLKASKFSLTDVGELRDFMLDYLPHGSVIAHDVIAHLNRLLECNVINDIDHGDILSARVVVAASAGFEEGSIDPEPQRIAFKDALSFAQAKSQWLLRKMTAERKAADALKTSMQEARAKAAARLAGLKNAAGEAEEI